MTRESASAACASMPSMFEARAQRREPKCDLRQPAVTNRHRRVTCGLRATDQERTNHRAQEQRTFVRAVMNGGQAVMNDTNRTVLSAAILTSAQDAPIV